MIRESHEASLQQGADTLLWFGCNTALRAPEIASATINVISKADVEFATLGEKEGCCGAVLILNGFHNEAERNAKKIVKSMEGFKILVACCPSCYRAFTDFYPNKLGIELPCKVQHISQFVDHLLEKKRLSFRDLKMRLTYHDPCELGRHCGVYDPPRHILKAIPGLKVLEMPLNMEYARCCGGGGGLCACAHPQCYKTFLYSVKRERTEVAVYDFMQIVKKAQI